VTSGARLRVGMAGRRLEKHLDIVAPSKTNGPSYGAYRNFDLVAPLGIVPSLPLRMHFTLTEADRQFAKAFLESISVSHRDYVVMAPGSKDQKKQWHVEGFVELAKRLRAEPALSVVVIYAPDERPEAEAVTRLAGEGIHLAPSTTLPQAVALIEGARLLICNDCAINHLSTTLQTPALSLFGKSHPHRWSPGSAFSGKRHLYKPRNERPSNSGSDFGISVEEAFTAAVELLNTSSPS
ncbi:MAG: hypothetical protein GF344_18940, partial [Chitinivibrionales bacterium]|nr:hypothetical protein [Chitinivibrionales bacterium]MBD3358711.1 hypothetical protein [Chitinivibrionales bacterium]